MLRDLDLVPEVAAGDGRRLEVVDGLPLFGGAQLSVDTTLVRALRMDSQPTVRRRKEATFSPGTLGGVGCRRVRNQVSWECRGRGRRGRRSTTIKYLWCSECVRCVLDQGRIRFSATCHFRGVVCRLTSGFMRVLGRLLFHRSTLCTTGAHKVSRSWKGLHLAVCSGRNPTRSRRHGGASKLPQPINPKMGRVEFMVGLLFATPSLQQACIATSVHPSFTGFSVGHEHKSIHQFSFPPVRRPLSRRSVCPSTWMTDSASVEWATPTLARPPSFCFQGR